MDLLDATTISRGLSPTVDSNSTIFRHGGVLLRALRGDAAHCALELLRLPPDHEVWRSGLVGFRRSRFGLEGYELVVEVDEVPVVSYPQEWPIRMLRDAGLTVLRVARALARLGMSLLDAHPWNILFHHARPVFIDLGSLRRGNGISWAWVCEWRLHCLLPVLLHAKGHHLLCEGARGEHVPRVVKKWFDRPFLRSLYPRAVPSFFHRARGDAAELLSGLERYLEKLPLREKEGEWSNYRISAAEIGNVAAYEPKQAAVDAFLRTLPPGRCLDLGCNVGYFSRMAVSHGHQVVAADLDEVALSKLYQFAREEKQPILPLRLNVMWPTPGFGMALAFPDALERLRSRTVLVVALLHHLCRGMQFRFEMFASLMNRLAAENVIVEFIPRDDAHVSLWPLAREGWYTMENLVKAMEVYFPSWQVRDSNPAPRKMLLFQRPASSA